MDRISADDWAGFIRECRETHELAEGTIETILRSARGTYSYAARRLNWTGQNTLALLERHELPSAEDKAPHRRFTPAELEAVIRAAVGQNKVIFSTGGTVGSRISETLGLAEDNLDLADLDNASITFTHQIDKRGKRVRLKSKSSERTIEIPRDLAVMLAEHLLATSDRRGLNGNPRLVFCTKTGRALSRRNVSRELRATMKRARFDNGKLAFPILSETDEDGKPVKVERGQLPSFHSFRHGAASDVIAEGDNLEEAAWLLGHKDSTVTARVYVDEVKTAERSSKRRAKLGARMGKALQAGGGSTEGSAKADRTRPVPTSDTGKVVPLKPKRAANG
jgi:integrase